MMKQNYQLVAWTKNITENENARLYLIPSLESEIRDELVTELLDIHREEYKFDGPITLDLARRAVIACEKMARLNFLIGHYGDGIRFLFFAARYCTKASCFSDELRYEHSRLCQTGVCLAKKYGREDILQESTPKDMLEFKILRKDSNNITD